MPLVYLDSQKNGQVHRNDYEPVLTLSMFSESKLEKHMPDVPEGFQLRPLMLTDFSKGYVSLLSQLTAVGEIDQKKFEEHFKAITNMHPASYYTVVIEDKSSSTIVASGTLILQWHFIHECGARGRIEDIVVDNAQRGKRFDWMINECLVGLAKSLGVFKLSLECKDELVPFYEQFGYKRNEGSSFMVQQLGGDRQGNVGGSDEHQGDGNTSGFSLLSNVRSAISNVRTAISNFTASRKQKNAENKEKSAAKDKKMLKDLLDRELSVPLPNRFKNWTQQDQDDKDEHIRKRKIQQRLERERMKWEADKI